MNNLFQKASKSPLMLKAAVAAGCGTGIGIAIGLSGYWENRSSSSGLVSVSSTSSSREETQGPRNEATSSSSYGLTKEKAKLTMKRFMEAVLNGVAYADAPTFEDWPAPIENWSSTHECKVKRIYRPSSLQEVEAIVQNLGNQRLRIIGSGLSPNGIAFTDEQLLSLENMNEILNVDKKKKQVTVEAGALVGQVLEDLKDHGLTLQNLASINQQQIGGFIQVGAHGTGASLPPVDEQIVSMEIVSPGLGTIELSASKNPKWFQMAKVGLGCFGVVTKVTLQCVDAHKLSETTKVMTREEVKKGHVARLKKNRHVRYMWIPYTNYAVVVTSNPASKGAQNTQDVESEEIAAAKKEPMISYLRQADEKQPAGLQSFGGFPANAEKMGFGELRDWLIRSGTGSMDPEHIQQVNQAELEFWKNNQSEGVIDDSYNVLAFDCGGQQQVLEVAMPCGTQSKPDGKDLEFVFKILDKIEESNFPAPAPIEQRWTCGSTSAMSPVSVPEHVKAKDQLFSWVGIIIYFPTQDLFERTALTNLFYEYQQVVHRINEENDYNCQIHWAKIEIPWALGQIESMQKRLKDRFPLDEFEKIRSVFDPNTCLTNKIIDVLVRGQEPPVPKPASSRFLDPSMPYNK